MNDPDYWRDMVAFFHRERSQWPVVARRVLYFLFPYALIFLSCIIVLYRWLSPLLQWDSIVDLPSHYIRSYLLNYSLSEGIIYPRWFSSLYYGYGYPLLLFTPPIPVYIISAFSLFTDSFLLFSLKFVGLLSAIIGGLGAYRFVSRYRDTSAGILCAVLYVSSPYPFIANLLARGALPESVALGALPWVLYFTTQLLHSEKFSRKYFTLSIIAVSFVLLTHNISSLIYVFLCAIVLNSYIIFLSRTWRHAGSLLLSIISVFIVAMLCSGFYLIDSLLFLSYVQNDLASNSFHSDSPRFFGPASSFLANVTSVFDFEPRRIHSALLNDRAVPFHGAIFVATLLGVMISGVLYRSNGYIFSVQLLFLGIVICILFLNTSLSESVWNSIPFLKFVQFPWRLYGVAYLLSAFVISLAWPGPPSSPVKATHSWSSLLTSFTRYVFIFLVFILVVQSVVDTPGYINVETLQAWSGRDLLSATESNRYGGGTTSGGEFLPKTAAWDIQTSPSLRRGIRVFDEEFPQSGWIAGLFRVLAGSAVFRSATFSDGDISFDVDCHEPTEIAIHQMYFPLWSAKMDNVPVPISIIGDQPRRNLNFGIMKLPCPTGTHSFELVISNNIYSITASAFAILAIVLINCFTDTISIPKRMVAYPHVIFIFVVLTCIVCWSVTRTRTKENRIIRDIFSDLSRGKVQVSTPAGQSWGFQPPFVESRLIGFVYGSESRVDRRRWIYSHPRSDLEINHRARQHEMFHGSCAMDPNVASQPFGDGVEFRVGVTVPGGTYEELFRLALNPRADPNQLKWHDFWISLDKYDGKDIIIRLITDYNGDSRNDWAGWGAPEIVTWPDPREDPGAIHPWFAPSTTGIAAPPSTWRRDR